jgi:hypothetical protein
MAIHRTGRDMRGVQDALNAYRQEIDEIVQMIPEGTILVRGAGQTVKERTAKFKARVKREYIATSSVRAQAAMSDIERRFYAPCVHRVFVALQMFKINTNPGPECKRALFEADSELSWWLSQLPASDVDIT